MINCLVTLFLNIEEEDEYVDEVVLIVKEILAQRLEGIKNEKGIKEYKNRKNKIGFVQIYKYDDKKSESFKKYDSIYMFKLVTNKNKNKFFV